MNGRHRQAGALLLAALLVVWGWRTLLQGDSVRAWLETMPGCG